MPTARGLMFLGHDYEDLEVHYPRLRLLEAGFAVTLAAPAAGETYRGKHGYPAKSDAALADIDPQAFDGLVVPGGWMPDKLRRDPKVLAITRSIHVAGKLVASICHGPWIDISAKIVDGYHYTSTPGIKDDLENAGAIWSDAPMVADRNRVSSRRPDDLPAFMSGILGWFASSER
jgi:protease I